jgi:tetratricopeptide (TPR) repeat protein
VTTQKEKTKKTEYEKALSAYNLAMKSFHKGEFEKTKESLGAFEKDFPEERELLDRVNMYLQICENRINPPKIALKTPEDYFQHGVYLMNQGQFVEALESLEKAHSKEPKDAKVLYAMADVSCLKDDLDTCLEYLKKAVELDPFLAVLARNEKDFEPLQEDPRFIEITTTG